MLKVKKHKMVLLKYYPVASRLLLSNRDFLSFQGHYINRRHEGSENHCQCHGFEQQKRTFFTFPKASRSREYRGRQLVGYSMEQMFEVVSDVENYYKFVPWCKQSLVRTKTPNHLKADLIVGFPPINESYTSFVTLVKPHLVKAECTDGRLFHHLLTIWRFSPGLKREQQSCVVDFHINFEFRSAFHSHLSNLFFDQVAKKMEGAFIAEVGNRHGTATMTPRNLLLSDHALKS